MALVRRRIVPLLWGLIGCSTVSASLVGCDESLACTLAFYPAGLRLRFTGPEGADLPAATYEIVLTVDGATYSLACGAPEAPDMFVCEPVEGSGDHRIETRAEFPGGFEVSIWRPEGNDSLGPAKVDLQVVSGDAPLVDATFTPTYERDEPNGDGCGQVDHEVEEVVVIDPGG